MFKECLETLVNKTKKINCFYWQIDSTFHWWCLLSQNVNQYCLIWFLKSNWTR